MAGGAFSSRPSCRKCFSWPAYCATIPPMSGPKPDFMDPFDDCPRLPARDLLRRLGYEPPSPDALDDFQLPGRLWEFIYAMAGRRLYLDHTNLLSDPELYIWLHDQWLEEEVADIPFEAEWNCHIDMTDFNNGLDPIIWLRHFANEKERADFAAEQFGDPAASRRPALRSRPLAAGPAGPSAGVRRGRAVSLGGRR
jgi:hypothetical protein